MSLWATPDSVLEHISGFLTPLEVHHVVHALGKRLLTRCCSDMLARALLETYKENSLCILPETLSNLNCRGCRFNSRLMAAKLLRCPTVDGQTATIYLAKAGMAKTLELVLSVVNLHQIHLDKALLASSAYGSLPIVEMLVQRGARVSYDQFASVEAASTKNHVDVVERLLEGLCHDGRAYSIALTAAVDGRAVDVLKMLCSLGVVDVTEADNDALMSAAVYGYEDVSSILLQAGAVASTDALQLAMENSHWNVAKLLSDAGAQPGGLGWEVALGKCLLAGQVDVAQLLLRNRARISMCPFSVVEEAMRQGNPEVIEMVRRAGYFE